MKGLPQIAENSSILVGLCPPSGEIARVKVNNVSGWRLIELGNTSLFIELIKVDGSVNLFRFSDIFEIEVI